MLGVERAIDSIHLSIQDIRNFIFGLRPELLEGTTLVAGLAALVDEYRHNMVDEFELRIPDAVAEPPVEIIGQRRRHRRRHLIPERLIRASDPSAASGARPPPRGRLTMAHAQRAQES
jgi:hypothetical protein